MNYYDEIERYRSKRAQYRAMEKKRRNCREGRILRQTIELIGEELKAADREAAVNTHKGGNCETNIH